MTSSIYITSAEGNTGKSTVALGLVELLSHTVGRVGVFRPVARHTDNNDYVMDMLLSHEGVTTTHDIAFGVTYGDVHRDPEEALSEIVRLYHEVERRSDFVVIVGTDYTDVAGATEFSFNARAAANLGAPVLLVLRGLGRSPAELGQLADLCLDELSVHHAEPVAIVVSKAFQRAGDRIRAELAPYGLPTFLLPNEPLLTAPTVRSAIAATHATVQYGDTELLSREIAHVMVGAMNLENILDRLPEGALVVIPGDRSEILLGLITAHQADNFPTLAGLLLSGGFKPPESIQRLLEGLSPRLPIATTQLDTFAAVQTVARTRGDLTRDSQRKIDTALALFEKNVDATQMRNLLSVSRPQAVTPLMFEFDLLERARSDRKHIVLPEGADDRILRAASTLLGREIAELTILGNPHEIRTRATELGLDISAARLVDPSTCDLIEQFAVEYTRLRAHKGMTLERARETVVELSYFGTMMVHMGLADGMVSGAMHTTANTIKPSFETIKTAPGVSVVSSVFLMCLADRVLVYGDCAVNPDPTAEQLADIAISSAMTAAQFDIEPKVAMLSYSTGESGTGADVEKVRAATAIVKERRPDLSVAGPIQYDAAVDMSVAQTKMPGSLVAGKATVFIFPDLNTGNNTYKAVQRSAGAVAIGPVLQGLNRPINDLSRGALVADIVNTVAITAIQAQAQAGPIESEEEGTL